MSVSVWVFVWLRHTVFGRTCEWPITHYLTIWIRRSLAFIKAHSNSRNDFRDRNCVPYPCHYLIFYRMALSANWEHCSLSQICECRVCQLEGPNSSHNDGSHDQSLSQNLDIGGHLIRIRGGSTKCARVLANWCAKNAKLLKLPDQDVIEVGSGTGLVGLSLAKLGARSVVLTDQMPVLDIVEDSISRNFTVHETHNITAQALYWYVIFTLI